VAERSFIDLLLGRQPKPVAAERPASPRIRTGRGARAEYDGATVGRRAAGWRRTRLDANSELSPAVAAALRGIARDLVRNNPYAASGIASIVNNLVGTGITFQVYRDGVIDDRLNKLAREHFDKPNCDAAGRHDLYGLQLQAARAIVESGAAVVRQRWRRLSDRLPLPFQLQVLEPDYIDPSKHGPLSSAPGVNGGYVVNGIQFSPLGRREGYWLYNGHPGAARPSAQGSTFVPAREIAHVFRADRAEQEHGATWFAPIILRMKDFGDFEDAELTRQKLASAFVGFVAGDDADAPVPGIETEEGVTSDGFEEREPLDYLEPGTFQYGRAGEEVTFSTPPKSDGYKDYSKISLLAISAGLGVPYEELTGDLSGVSFISGRLGKLKYQRAVTVWQWLMFIPQFCGSVERWFMEALEIIGEDTTGVSMRWTPPRFPMMDPATEIPAIRDAIRSGQMTLSGAAEERGEDFDTFVAKWSADAGKLDELGLIFDSDPRRVTSVGNAVQPTSPARSEPPKGN
jgi:lambda family phage portal protein